MMMASVTNIKIETTQQQFVSVLVCFVSSNAAFFIVLLSDLNYMRTSNGGELLPGQLCGYSC